MVFLRCQRCIQVGDANLQRLSLVSMPEIYFLERRQPNIWEIGMYPVAKKRAFSS